MYLPFFTPQSMGGSEIQAQRLANALIKKEIDVFFITPGKGTFIKYEIVDGIPVFRFHTIAERVKHFLGFKNKTRNPIHDGNVCFDYSDKNDSELLYAHSKIGIKDLIICIDLFISTFLILIKKRKDFQLLQINTISYQTVILAIIAKILRKNLIAKDSTMNGIRKMYMTPFPNSSRRFIIKNSVFVAMTKTIENNYKIAGIDPSHVFRIPNGIEINKTENKNLTLGFKCLFVGNLYQQPAKGIDILLKAWPLVIETMPQAKLTIVGDGNIDRYKAYAEQEIFKSSIHFTGKDDPKKYYVSHDLFILPSRREGLSNALIEAMHYGMPVVVTNISGNIDLVEHGVNGYIVPVNDYKSLAEGITYMLTHIELRKKCYKINKERIEDVCEIRKVASLYIALYKKILNSIDTNTNIEHQN